MKTLLNTLVKIFTASLFIAICIWMLVEPRPYQFILAFVVGIVSVFVFEK